MSVIALVICSVLLVFTPLTQAKKHGDYKRDDYGHNDYERNDYGHNDYERNDYDDNGNRYNGRQYRDYDDDRSYDGKKYQQEHGERSYGLPGRYRGYKDWSNGVGLLELFEGTWEGYGFTMISLPNYDHKKPSTGPSNFRVKADSTWERLTFTRVDSPIPNRGSLAKRQDDKAYGVYDKKAFGQPDINLHGLQYQQHIIDKETGEELHIEPGFFLRVPKTRMPKQNETYVRLATIPHGDSVLAQSTFSAFVKGGPQIDEELSTLPLGAYTTGDFLKPFRDMKGCLPHGYSMEELYNPNLVLLRDIAHQKILKTAVIVFDTSPVGGILNIPHVQKNANATTLSAIFWIEIVADGHHGTFLQLQYTQTVILEFLGVKFPHVSVATLRKKYDDYNNDYNGYNDY